MEGFSEYILQFLKGGPIYNLVGLGFALLGLFLTFFIPWYTALKRKPVYFVKNTNLVENGVESYGAVSVLYDEKKVQNLSVARIAFWNAGGQTIDKNDLAEKDGLRIEAAEGVKLLSAKVLHRVQHTNDFKVFLANKQKRAAITFDYFDKNQGVLLEVFHTGTSARDISIQGTIKGRIAITRIDGRPALLRYPLFNKLSSFKRRHREVISGVMIVMMMVMMWHATITDTSSNTGIRVLLKYVIALVLTLLYADVAKSLLFRPVPKGLIAIYDEAS